VPAPRRPRGLTSYTANDSVRHAIMCPTAAIGDYGYGYIGPGDTHPECRRLDARADDVMERAAEERLPPLEQLEERRCQHPRHHGRVHR
jgi:hypothetical protein